MTDRAALTMAQQADLLDTLADRATRGTNGQIIVSYLAIDDEALEDLRHVARRLRRMSLHETEIKKIVTRGR